MEKQQNSKTFGYPYDSWETDLTQTLGYYKMPAFPIHSDNAKAFIDRWLKAPIHWKQRFVASQYHQREFIAAISKLEEDWHEKPNNALEAIASRMTVIGGFSDNDACVYVEYEGYSFTLKVNAFGIRIFFGTESVLYPIRNGIGDVSIPSAYVIAVLAEYMKARRYSK